MKISKAGCAAGGSLPDTEDLALIRTFARGNLEPENVYTFSVVLCDNDIDRVFERFDEKTLRELAALFVGKTGISDHDWRSEKQVARIYRTELVRDGGRKTADGQDYVCLKAWAYMLRSEANEALIADIDGGIKKEVSVGCSVAKSFCSVCGAPNGGCSHKKGQEYEGQLCFFTLSGAMDAYEWSFVAVPAQRGAGVTKRLEPEKELDGDAEQLLREAELGRRYLSEMRAEVKRLALLCGKDFHTAVAPVVPMMGAEELERMKAALGRRVAERLPIRSQFPQEEEASQFDGAVYRV